MRASGWYRTTSETAASGGVAGTIYRWWDAVDQRWTQYVDEKPGPIPEEFRHRRIRSTVLTIPLELPRTTPLVRLPTP